MSNFSPNAMTSARNLKVCNQPPVEHSHHDYKDFFICGLSKSISRQTGLFIIPHFASDFSTASRNSVAW